jgi:hypothetical protein
MSTVRGSVSTLLIAIAMVASLVVPPFTAQPVAAEPGGWGELSSLSMHDATCVVNGSGEVYCWASSPTSVAGSMTPEKVDFNGIVMTEVSVGETSACALSVGGQVYCWGQVVYNEGAYEDSTVPVSIAQYDSLANKSFKTIEVGSNMTCVVSTDDELFCWGTTIASLSGTNTLTPVHMNADGLLQGLSIKKLSVNDQVGCAIASDDKAYCWGENYNGVLGDGTYAASLNAVAVNTEGVLADKQLTGIAVSALSGCALDNENSLYCWGADFYGHLGDDETQTASILPTNVDMSGVLAGKTIAKIESGRTNCVLATDGSVYCWGQNNFRGIDGTEVDHFTPHAIDLGVYGEAKDLVVGYTRNCVLTTENRILCWGYGTSAKSEVYPPGTETEITGSTYYQRNGKNILHATGTVLGDLLQQVVNPENVKIDGQNIPLCSEGTGYSIELFLLVGYYASDSPTCYWLYENYGEGYAYTGSDVYIWLGDEIPDQFTLSVNGSQPFMATRAGDTEPPIVPTISVGNTAAPLTGTPTIAAKPVFSGKAQPGAVITITIYSDPVVCTTTADSQGDWRCEMSTTLPAGNHTVRVRIVNPDTSVVELGPYPVMVASESTVVEPRPLVPPVSLATGPQMNRLAQGSPSQAEDTENQAPNLNEPRQNTQPTPMQPDESQEDDESQQAPVSRTAWLWILGVIIAVGILIAAITIARRKVRN